MQTATGTREQALTFAADHLRRIGYEVVARAAQTRYGVVDLVAVNDTTTVFADVDRPHSSAPTERRRRQRRRAAVTWLGDTADRTRRPEVRFDAITVGIDAGGRLLHLDHIEGSA